MNKRIKVKFISRGDNETWLRQFPNNSPIWGDCEFLFNINNEHYDWLVVYDEFPRKGDPTSYISKEILRCNIENTLLITVEPPNIKYYSKAYTHQFGWVLTAHPEWSLKHPGRIFSQPALRWFYGAHNNTKYNNLISSTTQKYKTISTVCSSKQQKHTLHKKRFEFVLKIKELLPCLDIYGRGINPIHDKSEAIDRYKYHLIIENYQGKHHWTEKLADSFLGLSFPFYFGCTNIKDYFPEDSIEVIDLNCVDSASKIIHNMIDNNEYNDRIHALEESKNLILTKYNLFSVLSTEIAKRHTPRSKLQPKYIIHSRKALRRNPILAITDAYNKITHRISHTTTYK